MGIFGDFQTIVGFKPYLHYALVLPTYGAIVGTWVGAHFVSICGIAISAGLFTWAARDVAERERQEPPPNLILSSTTFRYVTIGGPPYNWENATFGSVDPQVGLVARFANRAKSIPVGVAEDVRADIAFEDAAGNHVVSHPAPWLYCSSPNISFAVGATNELLVALDVLDLPQFPPPVSMAQGQRPQAVLRTVEDIADREPNAAARYSFHRGLSGPVKARINLTVNGLAFPPYELMLRPSDRNTTPQTPPAIESIQKPTTWWRRLKTHVKK